jgi:hypothetical protein
VWRFGWAVARRIRTSVSTRRTPMPYVHAKPKGLGFAPRRPRAGDLQHGAGVSGSYNDNKRPWGLEETQ